MQQSNILVSLASQECLNTDYFENQDLEALICPIGLGIVNNPVFDPCGHVFCKTCITRWLEKNPKCPVNNQPLTKELLVPAIPVRNLILNLNLRQCFNHCDWKGKLEHYEKHQATVCPETVIACPDCDQRMKRSVMRYQQCVKSSIHTEQDCEFRLKQCEHCKQMIRQTQLDEHARDCLLRDVECDACQMVVKKGVLDIHCQNECVERIISCQIEGCNAELKFKDLQQHMTEETKHLGLLQVQVSALKQMLRDQQQQTQQLQTQLGQIREPPYLDGWRLKFTKKEQTREWHSINSINKIGSAFTLKVQVMGLQARSNSWRGVMGISSKRLKEYLWYKSDNVTLFLEHQTFVWIIGGLKCQGNKGPQPYGKEVEGSFMATITLNVNGELIFDHDSSTLGPAFVIDEEIRRGGFYLLFSLINVASFRIVHYERFE